MVASMTIIRMPAQSTTSPSQRRLSVTAVELVTLLLAPWVHGWIVGLDPHLPMRRSSGSDFDMTGGFSESVSAWCPLAVSEGAAHLVGRRLQAGAQPGGRLLGFFVCGGGLQSAQRQGSQMELVLAPWSRPT